MSRKPNPTDADGFMEDLMRISTRRFKEEGIDLIDMGMGFYDGSEIIGVEKPMLLIFGNVACPIVGVEKQEFQCPMEIGEIKKGRLSSSEVANDILHALKEEFYGKPAA